MSKAADRSNRIRTDDLESAFAIRRASVTAFLLNIFKSLRVSDVLLILLWKYEALAVWTSAEKDESKY